MSKSILALGASSYIGRHFVNKYSFKGIISTFNQNKIQNGKKFNSLTQDLADIIDNPSEIECAIIFLGDTKPKSCIQNIGLSNELNVDSIIRILIRLKQWGIKPIFISTEFVFDGHRSNQTFSAVIWKCRSLGKSFANNFFKLTLFVTISFT